MSEFISSLAPLMRAFVSYRKASGRWNEASYEVNLSLFDKYCDKHFPNVSELSQNMADSWCAQRETEENNSCRSRIYPIVSFIRYLRKRGMTAVTEPTVPRKEPRDYIPHAFTEAELQNFFTACDSISADPPTEEQLSRRITVPVFFRLLYSSGIRTNEARALMREDVDLDSGIVNIRYSKGHAQHYVVLHDSMLLLMRQYDGAIDKMYPNRVYFFPARERNGGFHRASWVQQNFHKMWRQHNCRNVVPYELRHNYAVENINGWMGIGFDFNAKLLYLSKSMGHRVLESTKYYYSLVPGLADIIEAQTGEGDVIPEVDYESY
ncbi:site-specific tyrosine recombinase XerC [Pelotomaculum schinkii]|uniref:Site-specific tyrosine recombinase XerC n=1 Tax=Pelotomaculum schinkii TaxID=78350 RepID=A0A4Y7R685_9FIRM|nr:tyrosine-type recombinase/integrase [Pelotomaculum schinkii]TEB04266.1 site-specific tyrosine recombinase XerC [Pelotomaculum schinkii]